MNQKHFVLFLCLIGFSLTASAQTRLFFRLDGGVQEQLTDRLDAMDGHNVGLHTGLQFGRSWEIQLGIRASERTTFHSFLIPTRGVNWNSGVFTHSQVYESVMGLNSEWMEVPLAIRYHFVHLGGLSLYLQAGGAYHLGEGIELEDRFGGPGFPGGFRMLRATSQEMWSVNGGLGMQLNLGRSFGLFVEGNLEKFDQIDDVSARINGGFAFYLNKKRILR